MASNSRVSLSNLVASQLPEFIRAEYPTFVAFLEAYYEYMEKSGVNLAQVRDIDSTLDEFIQYFKAELAHNYPVSDSYDTERYLLKHVKDQYLAKGSEASYKLLFRLLYGKDVYMDYPGKQMLRVSDGKWQQDVSIFVRVDTGDAYSMIGKTVSIQTTKKISRDPVTSKAIQVDTVTATIENVIKVDGYTNIYEFFLDRNFYGEIYPKDVIKYSTYFQGQVLPCTTEVSVGRGGVKFRPGMVFKVSSGEGTPIWFKVLKTDSDGGLVTVDLIKFGLYYNTDFAVTLLPTSAVTTRKRFTKSPVVISYELVAGVLNGISIVSGGSGYQLPPAVIIGGNGSGATAHSEIGDGVISSVAITNPGSDFNNVPDITVTSSQGSGAILKAVMGTGDDAGKVVGIKIIDGGEGYDILNPPTITIVPVNDPNVTNATATCSINNGVIRRIIVDTKGDGYTTAFANIVAQPGDIGQDGESEPLLGNDYSYMYDDATTGFTENGYLNATDYWDYNFSDGAYVGTIIRQFFIDAKDTISENPALVNIKLGAVARYPGYFKTNDGFLDDSIFIQDSYYYQTFSYVIRIDEQLQSYASVVRTMLHPSGMALFGEYSINNKVELSIGLDSFVKSLGVTLYDEFKLDDSTVVKSSSKYISDEATQDSPTDNKVYATERILSLLFVKSLTDSVNATDPLFIFKFTKYNTSSTGVSDISDLTTTKGLTETQPLTDTNFKSVTKAFSGQIESVIMSDPLIPVLVIGLNSIADNITNTGYVEGGYLHLSPYDQGGYFDGDYNVGRLRDFSS